MAFAVGKYSNALCDRCGFEYPYLSLRTEWNNLKVCSECFETKHPQLQPPRQPVDPEALYQPRPRNGIETTAFQVVTTNGLTYLEYKNFYVLLLYQAYYFENLYHNNYHQQT